MKFKRTILLALSLLVIVLEALPFGAVCNFANPDGDPIRKTFAYFNLVPFGYANFGPFITALLSVALLVMCALNFLKRSDKLSRSITVLSFVTTIISLTPLLHGIRYVSVLGAIISVALLSLTIVSVINNKK